MPDNYEFFNWRETQLGWDLGSTPSSLNDPVRLGYGYISQPPGFSGPRVIDWSSLGLTPGSMRVGKEWVPQQMGLALSGGLSVMASEPIRITGNVMWRGLTPAFIANQKRIMLEAREAFGYKFMEGQIYGAQNTSDGLKRILWMNRRAQLQDFFSRLGSYNYRIYFEPDISSIIAALNALDISLLNLWWTPDMQMRLQNGAKQILNNVFKKAIQMQDNPDGGWPPEYTYLIESAISNMEVHITGSQKYLMVELDLEKNLGTSKELREGFHYAALLKQASEFFPESYKNATEKTTYGKDMGRPLNRNTLPNRADESDLMYPKGKRYKFFRSVVLRGGFQFPLTIWDRPQYNLNGITPSYEDTIQARVAWWGRNKQGRHRAPVWLLLHFGTRFAPQIRRYPIVQEFAAQYQVFFMTIITEKLNEILARVGSSYNYNAGLRAFRQGTYTTPGESSSFVPVRSTEYPNLAPVSRVDRTKLIRDVQKINSDPLLRLAYEGKSIPGLGRFGLPKEYPVYRSITTIERGVEIHSPTWAIARSPRQRAEFVKAGWSTKVKIILPNGRVFTATNQASMERLLARGGKIIEKSGKRRKTKTRTTKYERKMKTYLRKGYITDIEFNYLIGRSRSKSQDSVNARRQRRAIARAQRLETARIAQEVFAEAKAIRRSKANPRKATKIRTSPEVSTEIGSKARYAIIDGKRVRVGGGHGRVVRAPSKGTKQGLVNAQHRTERKVPRTRPHTPDRSFVGKDVSHLPSPEQRQAQMKKENKRREKERKWGFTRFYIESLKDPLAAADLSRVNFDPKTGQFYIRMRRISVTRERVRRAKMTAIGRTTQAPTDMNDPYNQKLRWFRGKKLHPNQNLRTALSEAELTGEVANYGKKWLLDYDRGTGKFKLNWRVVDGPIGSVDIPHIDERTGFITWSHYTGPLYSRKVPLSPSQTKIRNQIRGNAKNVREMREKTMQEKAASILFRHRVMRNRYTQWYNKGIITRAEYHYLMDRLDMSKAAEMEAAKVWDKKYWGEE